MKMRQQKTFFQVRLTVIAMALCCLFAFISFSQEGKQPKSIEEGKRPRSIDEGKATVTSRTIIKKIYINSPPAPRKPAFNWVVIRPEVEDALVKINNTAVAKSADGDFRKELPINQKYSVTIAAGSDYE